MKWHIISRIGEADTYEPALEGSEDYPLLLHFSGGAADTRVRESAVSAIEERYEATLSGRAHDFLYASMSAYIADLCVPRQSATDRWSRSFVLHLPVFDSDRWLQAAPNLCDALRFLTGDEWEIRTRDRAGDTPVPRRCENEDRPRTVSLLSGGVDSLVGAIDLLDKGIPVAFVSHHGGGLTPKFQNDTYTALRAQYGDVYSENQFFVVGPQIDDHGESSMRSRSVLFLGLGIAVATVLGDDVPLFVPENGLISLNIPLTRTRSGSSSTRTTHPHFIQGIRSVLEALSIPNRIEMPYRHMTKGEMLSGVADKQVLESVMSQTMSCSHPEVARWSGNTPGTHCGYCVPCLIRRAAVHAAGLEHCDAPYTCDVRVNRPTETRARDLRAFEIALCREALGRVPSFLRVLESGPLPAEEVGAFAGVFERGMGEVSAFLEREA